MFFQLHCLVLLYTDYFLLIYWLNIIMITIRLSLIDSVNDPQIYYLIILELSELTHFLLQ